ncbi:MAG: hypothetical protein AB7O26_09350 [Planctomycetaceae bacterium]
MTRLVKAFRWPSTLGMLLSMLALFSGALEAQETFPPSSVPTLDAPPAEDPPPSESTTQPGQFDAPTSVPPVPPPPIEIVPQEPQSGPTLPPLPPEMLAPGASIPEGTMVNSIAHPALLFRASDILRPDVVRGANYEIREKVRLDRYRFVFEVQTTWGSVEAHGMPMLELRLSEIRAIQRAKIISRDPQFVDGVLHAIKMTPKGAFVAVSDPVGSVRRFPQGLKRIYHTRNTEADVRAGCDVRRRIAVEIGCDPETTNPILICLLDEMSRKKGMGSIAAQV